MSQKTAIALAFNNAGYETHTDKLHRMMRESMNAGNGIRNQSITTFIAALHKENDPQLLWELFTPAFSRSRSRCSPIYGEDADQGFMECVAVGLSKLVNRPGFGC